MLLCIDWLVFFILRENVFINMIPQGWGLDTDLLYKLFCIWILQQRWMYNRIIIHAFHRKKQIQFSCVVKCCRGLFILIEKNRLFSNKLSTTISSCYPLIKCMQPSYRLGFNKRCSNPSGNAYRIPLNCTELASCFYTFCLPINYSVFIERRLYKRVDISAKRFISAPKLIPPFCRKRPTGRRIIADCSQLFV